MGEQRATRPYHSPLREQRAEQTAVLVLEALATVVAERGTADFNVAEVADRAGVALRTVYHHFPNRQALLDGLAELVDARLAELRREDERGWQQLETLDDLLDAVRRVFARLDELEPLSTAMTLISATGYWRARSHDQRTAAYQRVLAAELGDGADAATRATFAVVRHLLSANTWFALHEEFGIPGEHAGEAVARAVTAIVAQCPRAEAGAERPVQ